MAHLLFIISRKPQPTKHDINLINQFANLASIAIEREQTSQLIWQQANYDALTQLPNRNMLREHLKTAVKNADRTNSKLAIAMLDLDKFKDVNDSLGHDAGDLLLIETSKRISDCLRTNDIVARLGGDEFVILMIDSTGEPGVDIVGNRLLNALAMPYQIQQNIVYCTASVGVAIYPDDAKNVDTLMRNADQAMYSAKSKGRNGVHYFTESMRTDFIKRVELIQDLRLAIEQKQFHLVYQPIVNLETQKIYKAEALIRWQHPTKGLISPLDFIPIAEESGLIVEISDWIFEEVLNSVIDWRDNFQDEIQISINTSPIQYKNKGQQIIAWLDKMAKENVPTSAIGLEITENLLMENKTEVAKIIDQVRQKGITLSIDDFGTGYSSLSYLKNFHSDYVKIDKSFVQNMSPNNNDFALCEAIILMAKKLNIKVIAEGIETELQQQLLNESGCSYGQGYLFAKPLEKNHFEEILNLQKVKVQQ